MQQYADSPRCIARRRVKVRDCAGADVAILAGHVLDALFHRGSSTDYADYADDIRAIATAKSVDNTHSARSATAGSICIARRAGTRHAINDTAPSKATTIR